MGFRARNEVMRQGKSQVILKGLPYAEEEFWLLLIGKESYIYRARAWKRNRARDIDLGKIIDYWS